MPTESQYQQAIIELKDGLQLVEPVLNTNRGSLSDCLNFEVNDKLGYSRMGGFEKYDQGEYNSSSIYTNTILVQGSDFLDFLEGEKVVLVDARYKTSKTTLGYFVGLRDVALGDSRVTYGVILVTNYDVFISLVDSSSILQGVTSAATATFTGAVNYSFGMSTGAEETALLNELFYEDNRVREAPNAVAGVNNPITGLHWYKENCYAITDFITYNFTLGSVELFAGDILRDNVVTPTTEARVISVKQVSGSYSLGTAAGTIMLVPITGSPTGAQKVLRLGTYVPAITLGTVSNDASWGAGMWRSKTGNGGWEEVSLGYEFAFTSGTVNGPPPVFKRGKGNATVVPVATSSPPSTATEFTTWTKTGAATVLDCIKADDTSYLTYVSTLSSPSTYIQVKDFISSSGIPASSEITGISVQVSTTGETTDIGKYPYLVLQPFNNTGQIGTAKSTPTLRISNTPDPATTFTAADMYTLGSSSDTWGIPDVAAAISNGFGFNIAPRAGTNSAVNVNWRINYVALSIHYSANIDTYYFWNGIDDVTAPITSFFVDAGDWTTGDAHGRMQVADIVPVGSSTRTYIGAADQIRTAAAGAGSLVATVESTATYGYLPSLADLQANSSRYQMITANFYGNADWESIYGVSGAGQAFAYDGYYFRHIYTGIAPTLDDPRHIAYHQGALALGYRAGNVTLSVQGEPENYNGIQGATSIDLGDPVTGLVSMSGTSLGVFCRNSVNTIIGTNVNNYSYSTVSAAEGAIEYTATNAGGEPIYCSNKGISTMSQTAAYGNFLGHRLSEAITPWLVPRIQQTLNPIPEDYTSYLTTATSLSSAIGISFAYVCRSKGQYRLQFKDGTRLSMTLKGADKIPVFTIQMADQWTTPPILANATKFSRFIPLAASSTIDNLGRERIHISHHNPLADATAGQNLYYVYEQETSWSFCGAPIPYKLKLNENFLGSPFTKNTITKVAAHGLSMGFAPLRVAVGAEYAMPPATVRASPDISLPRISRPLSQDQKAVMNIAPSMSTGPDRSFNINLFYPLTGDGVVCPPFSVQMLLLQYKEGRADL